MNVDDVKAPKVTGDRLEMIFIRQWELMGKYHEIEKSNGLGLGALSEVQWGIGIQLDNAQVQYLLKDYAWRVTEEITESTEVINGENDTHCKEEAADALHFLVELLLIVGIDAKEAWTGAGFVKESKYEDGDMLLDMWGNIKSECGTEVKDIWPRSTAYGLIECLGQAMNCLKNKPWKKTQMETDIHRFKINLFRAFRWWMRYAISIGMDDNAVYDYYFRKSSVNEFRQDTDY